MREIFFLSSVNWLFLFFPFFSFLIFFSDTVKAGSGSVCEHQCFEQEAGGAPPNFVTGEEALFCVYTTAHSHSLGNERVLNQFRPPSRPPWAKQERYKSSLTASESWVPI